MRIRNSPLLREILDAFYLCFCGVTFGVLRFFICDKKQCYSEVILAFHYKPYFRRMQAGVGNSSTTTATHSGKSVAERLKERRKETHSKDNCSNGNSKEHTSPSCSTTSPATKTTVPLADVKPRRQRLQLDETQKNTLRVINQYLRELGMQ